MRSLVFALLFSQALLAVDAKQSVALPCEPIGVVVASNGSGLWFSCSKYRAAEKRASAAGDPTPPVGTDNDATDVYWLAQRSNSAVKMANADGRIYIFASPIGSRALFVIPHKTGKDSVLLYDNQHRVKELPIDSSFLLWSSDAKTIYYYGGSTTEADAWDVLGLYDLDSGATHTKKLSAPTEILRVCPATGHVFSATPKYPGFAGSTVEYTRNLEFVRKVQGWVGAQFSAKCSYVASEADYHGPLPWSIYDVKSGKAMFSFPGLDDEGKAETYRFVQWNPTHDAVLLREHIPGEKRPEMLEVFDVQAGAVLGTLPDTDVVAWSADGSALIVGESAALAWRPITSLASSTQK